ncbi:hypothetical protein ACLBXM_11370 [Xanthobacteraceae bacterium A53D]
MREDVKVVARRTDGLGQRLYAIVNAIYIAEMTKLKWGFAWGNRFGDDPYHSISPAESIFSEKTISDHMLDQKEAGGYTSLPSGLFDYKDIVDPIRNRRVVGWSITNKRLESVLVPELCPNSAFSFGDAFQKISFSDRINLAIGRANEVDVPDNSVAIHVRSGDVVYGYYRKWGRFVKKCIPIPIVRRLVKDLTESGVKVFVFSQNNAATSQIGERKNFIDVEALRKSWNMSADQSAIFDVILMSRCEKIVGGSSGFSTLASKVGNSPIIGVAEFYDSRSVVDIIKGDIENGKFEEYPEMERALCYWYMWTYSRTTVSRKDSIRWLEMASVLDEANPLYKLTLSVAHFSKKDFAQGETCLQKAMDCEAKYPEELPKISEYIESSFFDGWERYFRDASHSGIHGALYVNALFMEKRGEYVGAIENIMYAIALSSKNSLYKEVLRRLLSKKGSIS